MKLKEIKETMADLSAKIYLVGGAIRDYLLGTELKDIDLVVSGPTKEIAERVATKINGSFVILDEKRDMYRVVTANLIYDFSSLAGDTIEEDLQRRDFTINAVALNISNADNPTENWIDPLEGLKDIKEGKIKVVSDNSFRDDPLRILRMVRFKAQFGFTIEKVTKQLAEESVSNLREIANERIKEELVRIGTYSQTDKNIELLEKMGVMSILLPRVDELKEFGVCKYHQEDVWTHSLTAVKKVEELVAKKYWANKITEDKIPLLKIAALLHDYGKLFTEKEIDGEIHFYGHQKVGVEKLRPLLKELTFSNQELDYILTLIRYHMRPFSLYRAENLTFKGKYRFFKAGGEVVEDICLLAAADKMSTAELNNREQKMAEKLSFLQGLIADKEEFEAREKEKIISGHDLMEEFDLVEGPGVGRVLEKINELQAQGKISTRKEALKFAEQYIN